MSPGRPLCGAAAAADRGKLVVAILGKGRVGEALGARLIAQGFHVKFGSHSAEKLSARTTPDFHDDGEVLSHEDAVRHAAVVFLAVPSRFVVDLVARVLSEDMASKVVIDLTNPVGWLDGPFYLPPSEGSVSLALKARLPFLRVVKGFNNLALEQFIDPSFAGEEAECSICSNDVEAKDLASNIACALGFRAMDLGDLTASIESERKAIETWCEFRRRKIEGKEASPAQVKRSIAGSAPAAPTVSSCAAPAAAECTLKRSSSGSDDNLTRLESVDSRSAKLLKTLNVIQ